MDTARPDAKDSLAKLNRLKLLVDDYKTSRQQHKNPEIATWQEMLPLAAEVAVLAEFWGISYGARPFSDVAISWWKCGDPDVSRAISELRARLQAEAWRDGVPNSNTGTNSDVINNPSKPVTKKTIAHAWDGGSDPPKNPTTYLELLITDGSIHIRQAGSKFIVDVDDFLEPCRYMLLPDAEQKI